MERAPDHSPFTIHYSLSLTYLTQVAKAVDARVVAVAPAEVERVAADEPHVRYLQLVGDGLRLEHALAGELVDALRAGAEPAQQRRPVATLAPVAPRDPQLGVRLLHDLARLDGRPAPRSFAHRLFMLADGLLDHVRGDVEVGGVPDGAAVAEDERLRRLVADARPLLDLARHVAALLHDDDGDGRRDGRHLAVGPRADRARVAMFEEEHRLRVRPREQLFERGGV